MITVKAYVQKIGNRKFEATVILEGNIVLTAEGGQKRGAIKNLHTVCDTYHERFDPPCEPLPPREFDIEEVPDLGSVTSDEDNSEEDNSEEDNSEETSMAISGVRIPGLDKGWVTPISDPETWVKMYRATISKLASLEQDDEKPLALRHIEAKQAYRDEANRIMGFLGCVGPWVRMPSGDFWLLLSGEKDPTIKQARRGEGNRRERIRRWIKNEEPEKYVYEHGSVEQRQLAQRTGQHFQNQAKVALEQREEENPDMARLAYKLGFVVSLRSQGLPAHIKFERDLEIAGVTNDQIDAYLSKSSSRAAA